MATLLDHENEAEAAACRRIRQIVSQYECDEAESAGARALLAQIEARNPEPAPSADPLIWILAGALTLVIVLAAGMIARL